MNYLLLIYEDENERRFLDGRLRQVRAERD